MSDFGLVLLLCLGLMKFDLLADGSYEWLKVLKYHMEIRNVLQATTQDGDVNKNVSASRPSSATQPKTAKDFGKELIGYTLIYCPSTHQDIGYQSGSPV